VPRARACAVAVARVPLRRGGDVACVVGLVAAAHVHHMVVSIRSGVPVKSAVVSALVQIMYTSLFGLFAGFWFFTKGARCAVWPTPFLAHTAHWHCLHVRYAAGGLLACILSHSACNVMGFPVLWWLDPGSPLYHRRQGASRGAASSCVASRHQPGCASTLSQPSWPRSSQASLHSWRRWCISRARTTSSPPRHLHRYDFDWCNSSGSE
jgi:hypothetical protein